jgi:hypothetical protein
MISPRSDPPDTGDVDAILEAAFREVVAELGDESDEATFTARVNERVARSVDAHNRRPRLELGGLSPAQAFRLLAADWDDPDGPVRLRTDVPLERLEDSEILANARTLLALAIERDGLGATERGNLKVEAVETLAARWRRDDPVLDMIVRTSKRLREDEFDPVRRLRLVAGLAGLLRKRGHRFLPTRRARDLVAPGRAGELYALLFRTWLRKFNLAYGRRLEWPELQEQAAFTLLRLPHVAAAWRTAEELLPEVVLPYALESAPGSLAGVELAPIGLNILLLEPLAGFGLLERRGDGPVPGLSDDRFRATALSGEFVAFEL